MNTMKYSEIIKENKKLEDINNQYKIVVLSNIMVHQAKEICEYSLRSETLNAHVVIGDYDNILQESFQVQDTNAVIIFWEIYNLIDGLQYKIEFLDDTAFEELITKVKIEIDMVFTNLQSLSLVLINKFSTLIFEQHNLNSTKLSELSKILNDYIESNIHTNMKIVDLDKVISKVSISKSIDLRYYYSSKTLYSIDFYKEYFEYIKPIFLSVNGMSKKALIFDCDNTLWKGVLGEDGFDKIKMYSEVQYLVLELSKKGVIIGLCSKNNPNDVDEVLRDHKDMILREKDIVIKKVNWNDKVTNLETIAKELNIGLDSLVFIDDSDFEINLIKDKLPMIETFQVPQKEHEYPMLIRKISNLFYNPSQTDEDANKLQMYKAQIQRKDAEQTIGNIEDYLKSLELEISVYIDDLEQISRIAQMTQKTNQFNLTTKRYTENEIQLYMNAHNTSVIAIGVKDKFGDNGIVGLSIVNYIAEQAIIDTLLMSCRVLGRNIEYKFMDIIIETVKEKNISFTQAEYLKTLKNVQVSDFYDKLGFQSNLKTDEKSIYEIKIEMYKPKDLNYIGVKNGK